MREVADMLKAIHASEDRAAADQKVLDVVDKLKAGRMWKAAEMVAENANETLAYYAFPLRTGGGSEPTTRSKD